MKIDNSGINRSADPVGSPHPASGRAGSTLRPASPADRGDRVSLSSEALTIRAALEQIRQQPEIRQDLVDRMRALLAEGDVGRNAAQLADAIIDRWLATP